MVFLQFDHRRHIVCAPAAGCQSGEVTIRQRQPPGVRPSTKRGYETKLRKQGDAFRRKEDAYCVGAMGAATGEPVLQKFSGRRREVREEHSGASLIVGPNHIGEAAQRVAGAGKQATKGHSDACGYGFGRLYREPLFADVDADGWDCAGFKFEIDETLDASAGSRAPVFSC